MFSLLDFHDVSLSKSLIWSILAHIIFALLLLLYPRQELILPPPVHQVKLVRIKKSKKRRRKHRKKISRRKKVKKMRRAVSASPKAPPPPEEKELIKKVDREEQKTRVKILAETSHFQFNYYLDIIKNKILVNWHPDTSFLESETEMELRVSFRIHKSGEILDLVLTERSLADSINESALNAVILARPMPPLPEAYNEDYLKVNFTFFLKPE